MRLLAPNDQFSGLNHWSELFTEGALEGKMVSRSVLIHTAKPRRGREEPWALVQVIAPTPIIPARMQGQGAQGQVLTEGEPGTPGYLLMVAASHHV